MKTVSITVTRTYIKSTTIQAVVPDDCTSAKPILTDKQHSEIEEGINQDNLNWGGDDIIEINDL